MRLMLPVMALLGACSPPDPSVEGDQLPVDPAAWDVDAAYRTADGLIETYFTRPGTDNGEEEDPELDDAAAALFASANTSIDLCLFEFDRQVLVDAVIDAHDRGVDVRFVGDGDELHDDGYEQLDTAGVPMVLRNPHDRIMHNKFAVIDGRYVWTGSTNFSENGVVRNNNGSLSFDSPQLADLFAAEFDEMFENDEFGRGKAVTDTTTPVAVGASSIEVQFSPKGEPLDAMLEVLDSADHTVFFMIFSFTKAEISDKLIELHNNGIEVVGVFDENQGGGRYSVDEKLAQAGIPVFIDGNENALGWAGGKLHHKTMLVDPMTEDDPTVTFGSYNWSNNATKNNDENLIIARSPELAASYADEFCGILSVATPHPDYTGEIPDPCASLLQQVRINEVLPNPSGADGDREWVEIVNAGRAPVDLTGWMLGDGTLPDRHVFGGRVLGPGEAVVVAAGPGADPAPNRILSTSGYLGLANNGDEVQLRDATGVVIDRVRYVGASSGVSFNRIEDGGLSGDFASHDALVSGDSSPGWRVDGSPFGGDLIINELLPNPSGTDSGNEWVELVNVGTASIDIGGWTVTDAGSERHVFAAGTVIAAGDAFVLRDDDATAGSLSLNNSNETISLWDAGGFLRSQADYSSSSDGVSLNREVDGDRDADFVDHDGISSSDFSDGTKADGSPWGGTVIINEVLPNPSGADAGNEFVELVNIGTLTADLSGWMLGDAVNPARHVFGSATLDPGEALVVYDSGSHPSALVASTGVLGLNNGGDLITLSDADGELRSAVTYGNAPDGVSLNRSTDGEADAVLVPHDEVGTGSESPGTRADGGAW